MVLLILSLMAYRVGFVISSYASSFSSLRVSDGQTVAKQPYKYEKFDVSFSVLGKFLKIWRR